MSGIFARCIRHLEGIERLPGESEITWYIERFVSARTSKARVDLVKQIGFRSIAPLSESDLEELNSGRVAVYREWGRTYYYVTLVGLLSGKVDAGDEVVSGVLSGFQALDASWFVKPYSIGISESWLFLALIVLISDENTEFNPRPEDVWSWFVDGFVRSLGVFLPDAASDVLQKIEQSKTKHRGWGDFCKNVAMLTQQGVYYKKSGGPWTLLNKMSAKEGLYEMLREGHFKLAEIELIDFVEALQKLRSRAFYDGLVVSSNSLLLQEIREDLCS